MPERVFSTLENLLSYWNPHDWLWLVSYSGGKDSTLLLFAVLELARRRDFNIAVVYNDTGGDLPELRRLAYSVLDKVRSLGHTVFITKPSKTFFDYLLTTYSPPRWNFRWCCKRLKELPFKKLVLELSRRQRVLNLVGIRREEARWRNWSVKMVFSNLVYAAPLVELTCDDVWCALDRLSRVDRFYAEVVNELKRIYGSARRSGCWFCPLITRDSLLESRPELLKLKYEVLRAWCTGNRERIVELSKKYPELIHLTVSPDNIKRKYPCMKKCLECQVFRVTVYLGGVLLQQ